MREFAGYALQMRAVFYEKIKQVGAICYRAVGSE